MLGFTELPSEPDLQVSKYPALQFSLCFLGLTEFASVYLAKDCQLYIRVLDYVLLLYVLTIGKPAGLRPVRGFPALRGQVVIPADYYASSVASSDFQTLPS